VNVVEYAKNSYSLDTPIKRLKFALSYERQNIHLEQDEQVTFCRMESIGEQGEFDTSETRTFEDVSSGYTRFFEGDVLVAKITPCFENGKGAIAQSLEKGIGFGTTELYVLTPGTKLAAKYLYYITVSSLFRGLGEAAMTGAAGQKRVPDDFISDFPMWLPPLETQHKIVDYLDAEIQQIDALIQEKEHMLKLLEEKRAALVSSAVTKGLNPNAPMKDSGLEWLGEVPAHWNVWRAKRLFSESDERTETGEETLLSLRMKIGLVPHNDVSEKLIKDDEIIGYKITRVGQIVVNRMRASIGLIAVTPQTGLVSPDYAVFQPILDLEPDYFTQLFKTRLLGSVFRSLSKGLGTGSSGFLRIYSDDFLALQIPVPPINEQREILLYLSSEEEKTNQFEVSLQKSIELLTERRSALITAAVTGQLEIPGVTA
jgi:type I restriction enzyme, S subunit